MQRSPPVRRRDSGACQDTRRFNKPCQTATSTRLVSPGSMSLFKLNPVEPPWYVSRMPGGGGGVAPRGVPLSRSSTLKSHSWPTASGWSGSQKADVYLRGHQAARCRVAVKYARGAADLYLLTPP